MTAPRPAHDIKHLPILHYTFKSRTYSLRQSQDSSETGSTLWLSSQILAEYLVLHHTKHRRRKDSSKCLELGSGIGLLALIVRDCLGITIVASDLPTICQTILKHNIAENTDFGSDIEIQIKELDWCKISEHHNDIEDGYDMILMSDVIYAPSLLRGLLDTLVRYCTSKTTVYLAQEVRVPKLMETFLLMARTKFKVQEIGKNGIDRIVETLTMANDESKGEEEGDTGDWSGVSIYKLKLNRS